MALSRLNTLALSLVVGFFGMLLALTAWHTWQDHKVLHEIINLEIRRSQSQVEAK